MTSPATVATWAISGIATAGVIGRPWRWPEWIWAVAGAALLVALGLLPWTSAETAILKGLDVYLFLTGMMLLSETARIHGVFDWVAASAVQHARGSGDRLFALVYVTGVVVTTFLSNDATAVVLTPAVFAVARKAGAHPLPLLLACALVANAASFMLPISNPANLVLYGGHMPSLGPWLASFALPSIAAITLTYGALRAIERYEIASATASCVSRQPLASGGILALAGIVLTALLLLWVSALDIPLGLPTALAGATVALGVSALRRQSPLPLIRDVSWGVLPLVAGLFVLVGALDRTGMIGMVTSGLHHAASHSEAGAAIAGTSLAFASNLINNLPAGLIAGTAVGQAHPPRLVIDGLLIGVDLGPNLSVTGSLATILWLQAIRREGEDVSFWRFLKVGLVVMPISLAAALAIRLALG